MYYYFLLQLLFLLRLKLDGLVLETFQICLECNLNKRFENLTDIVPYRKQFLLLCNLMIYRLRFIKQDAPVNCEQLFSSRNCIHS